MKQAQMKDTWVQQHLTDTKSALPFSFMYDGQPSAKLLAEWPVKIASERLDEERSGMNVEGEIALPAGRVDWRLAVRQRQEYKAVDECDR